MPRPHVAALVHDAWNQRVARRLTDRGWGTRIVPHIGYGSTMYPDGKRVTLRYIPDLTFHLDDTLERAQRIEEIFRKEADEKKD